MQKTGGKKRSIRQRLYIGLFLMSLVIILFTSINVAARHYRYTITSYTERVYDYVDITCDVIDADEITHYVQTLEKDKYYDLVTAFLQTVANEAELRFIYVIVPTSEGAMYVWDVSGCDELTYEFCEILPYEDNEYEILTQIMNDEYPKEIEFARERDNVLIATAFAPIKDQDGNSVAVVGSDMRVKDYAITMAGYMFSVLISVMVIISLTFFVFVRYLKKNLLGPIKILNEATNHMVENIDSDEHFVHNIHTGDEIEELATSFQTMEKELREYISENMRITSERHRIEAELDLAARIQKSMLPTDFTSLADHGEFGLYASMTPARTVGGDFYDFFMTDEDHIALVIADVSGKGVSAALFMAISKALIKNRTMTGGSPSNILKDVNSQLASGNASTMFVTVWLAIIDLRTGEGVAANAGHEHPAVRRGRDGSFELSIYSHSIVLGAIENATYAEHSFKLNKGDALFVYTDGVVEATNISGQFFGMQRMLDSLNKSAGTPEEYSSNVMCAIRDYAGEAEQFDDITMLEFEYYGSGD